MVADEAEGVLGACQIIARLRRPARKPEVIYMYLNNDIQIKMRPLTLNEAQAVHKIAMREFRRTFKKTPFKMRVQASKYLILMLTALFFSVLTLIMIIKKTCVDIIWQSGYQISPNAVSDVSASYIIAIFANAIVTGIIFIKAFNYSGLNFIVKKRWIEDCEMNWRDITFSESGVSLRGDFALVSRAWQSIKKIWIESGFLIVGSDASILFVIPIELVSDVDKEIIMDFWHSYAKGAE
ncbi:hypothetical protein [Methylorubrum sp. SB2]|uniref:hypothetical protein n=1 Tax=Methylorubrum subtropicum TaxID=3138812 RepID=UPI00313DC1FE